MKNNFRQGFVSLLKIFSLFSPLKRGGKKKKNHFFFLFCFCSFSWFFTYWLPYFFFFLVAHVKFFFFFNFILFLNFTILYWFCHISKWIRHRHTCVPHPEPSSLLPPHTIPLGRPSAPAPSIQYRASNLDWWLVSYMIL